MTEYAAYLDASGHPSDQPYVVVAGFMSTEHEWLAFEPEWKDALERNKLSDPFHMADFQSSKRTQEEKGRILDDLINVINSRIQVAFSALVEMGSYKKVNHIYALEECLGTPYSISSRAVAGFINQWKRQHFKSGDHLLVFVEEGTKHRGDMEEVFRRDELPLPQPVPKVLAAVQPADLLAWEVFHYVQYEDRRRSLVNLLRNKLVFEGIFKEKDLIEACKTALVPLRAQLAPNAEIVYHPLPKRKRRRTIK